jgi:predicted nucleotidyltransferase
MISKQNTLLECFFNSSKQWHFEELRKNVKIGKPQLARWLKIFEKQEIIKRVKVKGKMPHYIQYFDSQRYKNRKIFFAREQLLLSGFIDHLTSISKAKVIIIFGSFTREDWNDKSDIDVFVYGNDEEIEVGKFEAKLKREIQLHTVKSINDLKKVDKLLPYIISGDFIKGNIQELGVVVHAKT